MGISASEEQQRTRTGAEPDIQVEHTTDDDIVVARLVDGLYAAIDPREYLIEHGRT